MIRVALSLARRGKVEEIHIGRKKRHLDIFFLTCRAKWWFGSSPELDASWVTMASKAAVIFTPSFHNLIVKAGRFTSRQAWGGAELLVINLKGISFAKGRDALRCLGIEILKASSFFQSSRCYGA